MSFLSKWILLISDLISQDISFQQEKNHKEFFIKNGLSNYTNIFNTKNNNNCSLMNFIEGIIKSNLICKENYIHYLLITLSLLLRLKKQIIFNRESSFRIIYVLLLISSKILDDEVYSNSSWGEIAGISYKTINRLESILLVGLDYNCFVSLEEMKGLSRFILD